MNRNNLDVQPSRYQVFTRLADYLRRQSRLMALLVSMAMAVLSGAHAFAEEGVVNINTAPPEVLAAGLSGVGLAKAHLIVEYREAHGPFESIEELVEVRGIGEATIERNRERLTLE